MREADVRDQHTGDKRGEWAAINRVSRKREREREREGEIIKLRQHHVH